MSLHKNVIIHFIGKVLPAVSQLFLLVLGVRLLGTEEFGKYNLLFSTSMIVSSLLVGWIQQSMLRYLHPGDSAKQIMVAGFNGMAIPAALIAGVVFFVFTGLYFNPGTEYLAVATLFTGLFSLFLVFLTLRQAEARPGAYAVAESMFYVISMVFFLAGVLLFGIRDSRIIFDGMLLSLLLLFTVVAIRHIRVKGIVSDLIPRFPDRSFFKSMLAYGAPITIWLLISNFYNIFDRYILNYYLGYDAVGIYGSVYDLLFKICGFVSLPVLLTYHPALARSWQEGAYQKGKNLIWQAVRTELLILCLVFGGVYFIKDILLDTLFGRRIPGLGVMYFPIAGSAVLWQLAMLIQKPLEFNFKQPLMVGGIIGTLVLNGVLNMLTIPEFGYVAAAYSTFASTACYFIFVFYFSRNQLSRSVT